MKPCIVKAAGFVAYSFDKEFGGSIMGCLLKDSLGRAGGNGMYGARAARYHENLVAAMADESSSETRATKIELESTG